MKKLLKLIVLFTLLATTISWSQVKVAKVNRALWPNDLNSVDNFDYASKMENLVYAKCIKEVEGMNDVEAIKAKYNIKSATVASFEKWQKQQIVQILENLHAIKNKTTLDKTIAVSKNCDWKEVVKIVSDMNQKIPENLKPWYENALDFHRGYVYEQARLAFLFPKTTSEILTFAPNEITGEDYKDKEFLLTFDDGPTPKNGTTDDLISTLKTMNVNGMFFVLGEALEQRIGSSSTDKVAQLYGNNRLFSHGKVHKSHQHLETWKSSIDFTFNTIETVKPFLNKRKYFRPPYGQRTEKVSEYLNSINASNMLWNIDSQDWNAKISAAEVTDRITTLMLLRRKGIILFHDIHPKANVALPTINKNFLNAGVVFVDANRL